MKCLECCGIYIRQNGRNIKTRDLEHINILYNSVVTPKLNFLKPRTSQTSQLINDGIEQKTLSNIFNYST